MPSSVLRILIATGIFPPDVGGPANFVPRIAQWLVDRGHSVRVVCWSDTTGGKDSLYPFKVHRILRRASRLTRFVRTVLALYDFGRQADVIFANGLDLEARLGAMLLRKPELHRVVGDRAWEIARVRNWYAGTIDSYQTAKKSLRLRLLDKLRDFSLSRATLIITPSQYLAKIVRSWSTGNWPLRVVHNSTPLDQPAEEVDLPRYIGKTILTVCRLVPWKGIDRLIDCIGRLPDCRLVIAGDGAERKKLQEHAIARGIGHRVFFVGAITKPQVRGLMEAADVFVLNSGYEGMPHVVLEAMAARLPVVATDVGGTSEVVRHNHSGLLVQYEDDRELLTALRGLLANAERRGELARHARRMVEKQFAEETCFLAYEGALIETMCLRKHGSL